MNSKDTYKIVVKTQAGLEEALAAELQREGAADAVVMKRSVSFTGNDTMLYKVNYKCRTALRALKVEKEFHFENNTEFYEQVKTVPWHMYLSRRGKLAVEAIASKSIFSNTMFVARLTKDAIADSFREKYDMRPDVDVQNPDLLVNVHIHKNFCTISLDSSVDSLHKRGYRKINVEAPLNEVTAAGIISLTEWNALSHFFDPMCGSGTLLIEAAMAAMEIPAGYYRRSYGFMKWKTYDAALFESVVKEADGNIKEHDYDIAGADISGRNIGVTSDNLKFARLNNDVTLKHIDFFNSKPPFDKGTIITNPPYGERLKVEDLQDFYTAFGNTLKHNYAGYTAWVFAQDNPGLKHIGLRPSRKISLFNGKLECKLLKFDLFEGKRHQP